MKPPVYNKVWPDDVKALYRHDMQEMWDQTIAPQVWNQYHNQLEIYCDLAAGQGALDILDVGCAQGTLALLLAERGHRVWAMDIRPQFIDYARTRYERGDITFIRGNALEIGLRNRFDLIYANQVIEHLVYPLDLLRRLVSWLKPGGRVVMTTPNADYIKNNLPAFSQLGDPSQYEHLQHSADADGHFYAYKDEELIHLFQQAGLQSITASHFESLWISGHMKVRYLHGILPANILQICDRMTLSIPFIGKKMAHQLLVVGALP
jgi:2-polyprenyl-3-methyl-5-hydroxy-6-metoxy-1,4-benzoquinol methylase